MAKEGGTIDRENRGRQSTGDRTDGTRKKIVNIGVIQDHETSIGEEIEATKGRRNK